MLRPSGRGCLPIYRFPDALGRFDDVFWGRCRRFDGVVKTAGNAVHDVWHAHNGLKWIHEPYPAGPCQPLARVVIVVWPASGNQLGVVSRFLRTFLKPSGVWCARLFYCCCRTCFLRFLGCACVTSAASDGMGLPSTMSAKARMVLAYMAA